MQLAKPEVFVLIRIPKTGSTSFLQMIQDSLPNARHFGMPYSADAAEGLPWSERLRATRSRVRRLLRHYGALTFPKAWQYVDRYADNGDLISGHIRYGDPALPRFNLNYVTLLREPVARALSEYNYTRIGYLKRNFVRQAYISGRVEAAGKYSFSGYLAYLDEHTNGNANAMSSFALGREPVADPLAFVRANYFHVGVLERLEQFASEFSAKLGVPVQTRKSNVTPLREAHALSKADRPVFERIYGRDIALYEAVLAHLEATAGTRDAAYGLQRA